MSVYRKEHILSSVKFEEAPIYHLADWILNTNTTYAYAIVLMQEELISFSVQIKRHLIISVILHYRSFIDSSCIAYLGFLILIIRRIIRCMISTNSLERRFVNSHSFRNKFSKIIVERIED